MPRSPRTACLTALLGLSLAAFSAAGQTSPAASAAGQTSPEASTAGQTPVAPRFTGPRVIVPVRHDVSPPLDEIARTFVPLAPAGVQEIEVPETVVNGPAQGAQPQRDPVVQGWPGLGEMPAPEFSFEGLSNEDNFNTVGTRVTPPDTNGDIGPNHYVQTVNLIFAVYDRSGNRLLGPLPNNAPWAGFGGDCQNRNNGDPIVLYDPIADRWLLSQFTTASPYHQCVAISTSPDPTGSWYRYDYVVPSGIFNDYPKFGVWPDGYYMSAGSRGLNPGPTSDVFVFERSQMLAGGAARMVAFTTPSALGYVAPMPADLDGATLPPSGAPNYFVGVKQSAPQALYLFRFHADWTNPANSTFGVGGQPNHTLSSVAPFTVICPSTRNCIPQPGATIGLDALAGRYVMYRAAYRNFGTHESIVFNGTVDAGSSRAAVRWYELRDPGSSPSIHQQGTYAPSDGVHRWMGSAAMDKFGNLAVGYSASSATVFPSIHYAGRLAGDPLGELTQGEAVMITGSGSQTSTGSRWGDYSMLAVDPVDDCTFWYTTEYYATTSVNGWQTRVGRFRFPGCLQPDFAVSASPTNLSMPVGGSGVTTVTVQSLNGFSALVNASCLSATAAGVSCSFDPGGVTPPPDGSATTALTLSASAQASPGTYVFHVVGTSGSLRRRAQVTVTVTP